ncbi:MAG: isochorismatase family protein [Chloroflexota bacterium]
MIARHPLPLLTNEVPRIELTQEQSMVLLQDIHRPFADAQTGQLALHAQEKVLMREFDEYFQALELGAPNISRVLSTARELSLHVAFSCLGCRPPMITPSAFQRAAGWLWELDTVENAFSSDWRPLPNEPIFVKPGWGALATPQFVQHLEKMGISNVILLGTMFEFGIRQSAQALADLGIGVLVVSDGVVALTQAGEKQARGELAHGLIKLRTTAELLDLLERLLTEEAVLV